MTAERLRVAIVENSPEVHLAIMGLLESAADLCIVVHAGSLVELAAADRPHFDVLIADLRICMGSATSLKRLRERYPALRLIVTTMNGGREYQEAIGRLSPDAWLPKPDLGRLLISTLRSLRLPGNQ